MVGRLENILTVNTAKFQWKYDNYVFSKSFWTIVNAFNNERLCVNKYLY